MSDSIEARITARILAVGELLWDLLPGGARLGGTTANFALGCARLGWPAALVTCLGDDELGRRALAQIMATAGDFDFDASLIQISSAAPTGTVDVSLGPDGHPRYNIVAPVAWDHIELTAAALGHARTAKALCFGTLAQREQRSRTTIRSLVEATPAECVIVFDVNARLPFCTPELVQWSLRHATIAKISEEELELVCGFLEITGLHFNGLATAVAELQRAGEALLHIAPGCKLVAITLGARGSLLVTRDAADYHPGFRVQVVDTVGAGDAFTCGMTHAYLHGASLAAINTVGNLYGSFVASQPGAMPELSAELRKKISAALEAAA